MFVEVVPPAALMSCLSCLFPMMFLYSAVRHASPGSHSPRQLLVPVCSVASPSSSASPSSLLGGSSCVGASFQSWSFSLLSSPSSHRRPPTLMIHISLVLRIIPIVCFCRSHLQYLSFSSVPLSSALSFLFCPHLVQPPLIILFPNLSSRASHRGIDLMFTPVIISHPCPPSSSPCGPS